MPRTPRKFLLALAGLLFVSPALAQNVGPLESLSACRLDADRIALSFSYWGGACEEMDAPETEISGAFARVSVPIRSTSEVCTAQAVLVEFAGVIDASAAVTSVDVLVLNSYGGPQAGDITEVAASGSDCTEPEAKPE